MKEFFRLFCAFLLLANAKVKSEDTEQTCSNGITDTCTSVVSHAFCEGSLPPSDKKGKKTLEEVHTYAELKHDPHSSLPESFTICSTISATSCQSRMAPTFFNILDNQIGQWLAPFLRRSFESKLGIDFSEWSKAADLGKIPPWFPYHWTKSCMAINTTSGSIDWVVEGTLMMAMIAEDMANRTRLPKNLSKNLVLGATEYGGKWFAVSSKVTNLNIFSSSLPIEKMKTMTKRGSCVEEGDYLAWGDMQWILHGQANQEIVETEEPCEGEPLVNLYYTQFPGRDSCMHHCENLGTRAPSVTTFEEWTLLQQFLKAKLYDRGLDTMYIWLSVDDSQVEGEWRDFYTGRMIQDYELPWMPTQPDGGRAQNCALLMGENIWDDESCDFSQLACMCSPEPEAYLKLRGLCPSSAIDVHYKPTSSWTDSRELTLQGQQRTSIVYDKNKKIWTVDVAESSLNGTSKASHASFTLGRHNWTITGDDDCNSEKEYVTELKMSGCQEAEFTCNDGQCVSMDTRCNQLPDCRDKSDEKNCQILVLEEGYNIKVPPIQSDNPVNVSVSINLLKLVDIDEDDYSIEIQFEITMKWTENRATYHNLKNKDSLNALPKTDYERLWLPKVIYENTDQKESTRLGVDWEWDTRVLVKREGKLTRSGLDTVDETEIFKGPENRLIMSQIYTHTFQCAYKLSAYPFDTQVIKGVLSIILGFLPRHARLTWLWAH